ncbi:hypothetical protein PIB30_017786 [Stylosanthes scabra]|uniref:GDSL esterase/lipase n=1 Tax=Stylosanthes scabra TaxID=79078 RepID=A0ABU6U7W9_9FABA|nr:hypothetical protein [Stylosanthes scabra]
MSALFAFGDSTIDPGNNNGLHTLFRGDHLPYGCDFPNHTPTGRFSNGKISTDYIVDMLGIKSLLPAYLDHGINDEDLLTGVSFGAGGSGLDSNTAAFAQVMNMDTQLEKFEQRLERIRGGVGDAKANNIVKNALFVISSGTNDMLYNAYLFPARMMQFGSVSSYHDFLLQNLDAFIQKLYEVGARMIVVVGLPPIGCLPIEVTINSVMPNPDWLHRFEQTLKGCCRTGMLEMGPVCNMHDPTCADLSKYLFWDAVHLTEAGYKFLAESGIRNLLAYFTGSN